MNAKKFLLVPAAVLLAAVSLSQAQYGGGGGTRKAPPRVLNFSTMVGVGGFLLSPNDVRGVVGDVLPWQARSIKGQLLANGQLTIKVRGLVFPDTPSVPEALRGINDEPQFFAVLSCVTDDGQGGLVTTNQTTVGFNATSTGNANITTRLTLPATCAAPIVFITGADGKWFAMTGVTTGGS
jgi:hypothetical protein